MNHISRKAKIATAITTLGVVGSTIAIIEFTSGIPSIPSLFSGKPDSQPGIPSTVVTSSSPAVPPPTPTSISTSEVAPKPGNTSATNPVPAALELAKPDNDSFITNRGTYGFRADTDISIDGKRFFYGLVGGTTLNPTESTIIFDLGRDYRRFTATVGTLDRSYQAADNYAAVKILGDGKVLYEKRVTLGSSFIADFSVTGVLRLDIVAKCDRLAFPAIGDPQVTA